MRFGIRYDGALIPTLPTVDLAPPSVQQFTGVAQQLPAERQLVNDQCRTPGQYNLALVRRRGRRCGPPRRCRRTASPTATRPRSDRSGAAAESSDHAVSAAWCRATASRRERQRPHLAADIDRSREPILSGFAVALSAPSRR